MLLEYFTFEVYFLMICEKSFEKLWVKRKVASRRYKDTILMENAPTQRR